MGEMVRNLPEQAMAMFKWDEYGRALISSLGFNADNWIKSEEIAKQEAKDQQQDMINMESEAQNRMMMNQMMGQGVQQAATQDIEQTGGAGVQAALAQLQQMGGV